MILQRRRCVAFLPSFYARIDQVSRSLTYTNAGHLPGYIKTASGDIRMELDSTTMPPGMMSEGEFPLGPQIGLQSGDSIFLYSDGVTEAISPNGKALGIERALQVLRDHRMRSAGENVDALYQAVSGFVDGPVLEDDVTTILIKVE